MKLTFIYAGSIIMIIICFRKLYVISIVKRSTREFAFDVEPAVSYTTCRRTFECSLRLNVSIVVPNHKHKERGKFENSRFV